MKPDERAFLLLVYERGKVFKGEDWQLRDGLFPRDLIPYSGLHYKRAWYLLGKWSAKGWYDYGTTLDSGWLTPEGAKAAQELEKEVSRG